MNRKALLGALTLVLSAAGGCEMGGYDLAAYQCIPPGCDSCADPCCQPGPCGQRALCSCTPAPSPCPESMPAPESQPDWIAGLRSNDRVTQERAIDALARQGSAALPEVELLLPDPDPRVRFAALQVLVRLREEAAPSVYDVKFRLADQDPAIRAEAATVIGLAGCHGAEAVPELVSALEDTSPVVRYRVAIALQNIGGGAEPARQALERHMRCDRDPRVREAARCALYRLDQAICHQPDGVRR